VSNVRIGVDIIEIARVGAAVARHGERFLSRVYTAAEREYCQGSVAALAARWAAKEAAAKALGTGVGDVCWREIEVVCGEQGAPSLRLHGQAKALAAALGITQVAVSLSHSREQAIAVVIAG
jgi:holo-[acyl-carrier protein] synthase